MRSPLVIVREMRPETKVLILLLFLSPMIGELLSGSAPPLEFFSIFGLTFLVGLYGCGAVLIRETAIRWDKGWASIMLMGAAYGIVEEGLAVKSWFDPHWMDLAELGWYGRWMGTNTVWAVWLTIFHMVFSIAIPIMLVDLAFPGLRGRRITTDRQYRWMVGIFAFVCIFIFLFLTKYFPPPGHLLLTLGAVILLAFIAFKVPDPLFPAATSDPDWTPVRFYLLGAVFGSVSFIGYMGGWSFGLHPLVLVMVLNLIGASLLWLVLRHMGRTDNGRQMVALVAGLLTFLVLLSFIHEVFTPSAVGMSVVGTVALVSLVMLYRRVGARERPPSPHVRGGEAGPVSRSIGPSSVPAPRNP